MKKILPKGHLSCYAKGFRYKTAASTDVARTFARVRKRMEEERRASETERERNEAEVAEKVRALKP